MKSVRSRNYCVDFIINFNFSRQCTSQGGEFAHYTELVATDFDGLGIVFSWV